MMITEAVERWSTRDPGRAAIVSCDKDDGQYATTDYGTLVAHIRRLSQRLKDAVKPGNPIALRMSSDALSVAALLATLEAGYPVVLLPAGLSGPEEESILGLRGISSLFDPPSERLMRVGGHIGRNVCPAGTFPEGAVGQLTSGTTSDSRIALRTAEGIGQEIEAVQERLDLEPVDRVISASSLAHSYGLIGGTLAPLTAGAQLLLVRDSREILNIVGIMRPTVLFGLAATYQHLMEREWDIGWLADARHILSAGAPLPRGLADGIYGRAGVRIKQDYGTTETGTISIDVSREWEAGCVGKPLEHMNIRLGKDHSQFLPRPEIGEIQVRSDAVAGGYLMPGGGTMSALDDDGWFRTRDAGWIDGSGRLFVGQRIRDAIPIVGTTVRPEAVERVLCDIPGVREAVVFSAGRGSEMRIKAVVAAPQQSAGRILSALIENVPELQDQVDLEVRESLPRSAAGKVLQKYLV
ncbi:MAG TPA: class I adenylate-forming enzyme family protein [Chloroflexota bacterium]